MSSQALQQTQLGKETVWGTGVAGSVKLMGVEDTTIDPNVTTILQGERRGSLQPGFQTNISQVGGSATLDMLASYEDTAYVFDSVFSEATPGTSPGYTRTYGAPTSARPTPRYSSIVHGQTGGIYRLEGALGTQLVLSGEHSAPLKVSTQYQGMRVVSSTLAALSDRTVNFAMGDQAKLYIDAWAGTIGTTEITATSWSFQLTINPNRSLNRSLGSLVPISWHDGDAENRWGGELKLSLEVNATTAAYINTMLASTPAVFERQIRIRYSLDANHVLTFDFAGAALAAPTLFPDMDGIVSVDLTLTGKYNPTLGNWFAATLTAAVQTLA